jgi:hypothetical protein
MVTEKLPPALALVTDIDWITGRVAKVVPSAL